MIFEYGGWRNFGNHLATFADFFVDMAQQAFIIVRPR